MTKPKRLIPFREGLARLQLSKSGYYNQLKTDPTLPRVVKPNGPGTRTSAFYEPEIDARIEQRVAERSVAGEQR
jgi:predicted DNA-binding transcriptional regulator AlpA